MPGRWTVVGFPNGTSTAAVKAAEAERALDDGAAELDMVLPIGWLRSGGDAYVQDDIAAAGEQLLGPLRWAVAAALGPAAGAIGAALWGRERMGG